ncbi:zinc finger protein 513a [Scleropages formosus]|uniref:Zinc finger protein 513 n=2 Tax=Scleropages formosus TaxID=113540 RepID=A0A8C9TTD1_SCLFO|nr:zinc finger protein 513-like [Scleropages formosus]
MPRRKQLNPQPVKYTEYPGNFVLESNFLFGPVDNKTIEFGRGSGALATLGLPGCPLTYSRRTYGRLSMEGLEEPRDADGTAEGEARSKGVPCLSCRPHGQLPNPPPGGGSPISQAPWVGCGEGCGPEGRGESRDGAAGEDFGSAGDAADKVHSCELCGFSSRYANHVKRHMKTHNGEKPYRCLLCAYASAQLVNLQRHVRVHTGEKPYKCQHCAFACSSLGNLKRHQRMHAPSRRAHCADRSAAADAHGPELRAAGQRAADGPSRATAEGAAVSNLALHVKSDANHARHYGQESPGLLDTGGMGHASQGLPNFLFPYACTLCGRGLADEGSRGGRTCGKCVSSAASRGHCASPTELELSDKPYSCAVCSFVTHYPNHLVRHMKTHSGEKPYRCPDCDYASAHLDNLKRHHRVHTGEKPYRCALCDYACGNLANLKRHQRVHSGAKPFKCAVCSYSCNQSMNLKRHMLRHTGEKPFACQECPYTTGHWDNYKRHQKKHGHGADGWTKVRLPDEEGEDDEP